MRKLRLERRRPLPTIPQKVGNAWLQTQGRLAWSQWGHLFPSEVRGLHHLQTAGRASPGQPEGPGTQQKQRGPMPVFAQAACSPSPSRAANTDVRLAFSLFQSQPSFSPRAACQAPHSWRELQAARTRGAWVQQAGSRGDPEPLWGDTAPVEKPRAGPPMHPAPPRRPRPLTLQHAPVGRVGDGVDVGRHLVPLLALVHVDDLLRVDGQLLVGIDHHAEEARVRLPNREASLLPEQGRAERWDTWLQGRRQDKAHRGLHFRSAPCTLSCSSLTVALTGRCTRVLILEMGRLSSASLWESPLALLTGQVMGEEKQGGGLDF